VRERLRARGTLVVPESTTPPPGPEVWRNQPPGAGRAVLEALLADREEGR